MIPYSYNTTTDRTRSSTGTNPDTTYEGTATSYNNSGYNGTASESNRVLIYSTNTREERKDPEEIYDEDPIFDPSFGWIDILAKDQIVLDVVNEPP